MTKPIKILIVDDEEDILEFLEYNLEKVVMSFFKASDGQQAIERLRKRYLIWSLWTDHDAHHGWYWGLWADL